MYHKLLIAFNKGVMQWYQATSKISLVYDGKHNIGVHWHLCFFLSFLFEHGSIYVPKLDRALSTSSIITTNESSSHRLCGTGAAFMLVGEAVKQHGCGKRHTDKTGTKQNATLLG